MARYKHYDYGQTKLLPSSYERQIFPGSFEYTLSYLIDNKIDLSVFDDRYQNDDTGFRWTPEGPADVEIVDYH